MTTWNRRSFVASSLALASAGLVSAGQTAANEDATPVEERPGWTSYRGNAANAAHVPTDEFERPDTVAWTAEGTGDVAVADGRVYLRTEDDLRALDADDGSLEWDRESFSWKGEPFEPTGTPAVGDGIVYVAGNQLTALNAADGTLVWEAEFDGDPEMTSPTLAYGTVYVVVDGRLCAYDAAEGELAWELEAVDVEVENREDGPPEDELREYEFKPYPVAVADERVYAITEGERFEAVSVLDAHTGDSHWNGLDRGTTFRDPIVVDDETIYSRYDTPDIRLDDESSIRTYRGLYEDVIPASNGDVTITGGHYDLRAVEKDWSIRPGWVLPFHNATVAGDTGIVYFVDRGGGSDAILGVNVDDGSIRWEITDDTVSDTGISRPFVVDEDTLYLQSDGQLVALRPSHLVDDSNGDGSGGDDSSGDDSSGDSGGDDGPSGDDGSDDDDDVSGDDSSDDGEAGPTEGDGDVGSDDDSGSDDDPVQLGDSDGSDDESPSDDVADADDADSIPGFGVGAGLAGSALGLEWLRRHGSTDEADRDDVE